MSRQNRLGIVVAAGVLMAFGMPLEADRRIVPGATVGSGGGGQVSRTLHNLSVTGPGEIRALSETQVCKFCHIPHSTVLPKPLWGHALSDASYDVPEVTTSSGSVEAAPQPEGASRLCLSCHDGTVALGAVGRDGERIRMRTAERLAAGHRGFIGTDLTGSHPLSIGLPDALVLEARSQSDMRLKPLSVVEGEGIVHLDERGRIQCTTCHDPHNDSYFNAGKVPHFWVRPTVTEVCEACHVLQ